MIDAELVQDGGVEIMEVHAVVHRGDAVFVGGAVAHSAPYAASSHPEGEPAVVVIPAVVLFDMWSTAKLPAPDDECFLKHAALLEILEQGGEGLVSSQAVLGEVAAEAAVLVPVAVTEFDKAHA